MAFFLRIFFIYLIFYLLFKFLKIFFNSNTKTSEHWEKRKTANNDGYYKNITDQKIEDAEYEDIETEKNK